MDYNLTLFKDSVKDILLTPLTSGFGNMSINTNTSSAVATSTGGASANPNTNSSGANNNSAIISPNQSD